MYTGRGSKGGYKGLRSSKKMTNNRYNLGIIFPGKLIENKRHVGQCDVWSGSRALYMISFLFNFGDLSV